MLTNNSLDQNLLATAKDHGNRDFIAAWQRWRSVGQLLPRRTEIDLTDIKHLLGRVILFELIGKEEILVKVAGSQLRELADFEATGKNLRDLTPIEQWPVRRWRMNQAVAMPCGARQININRWTRDGSGIAIETVTLPIEPDDPTKPRLLMSNVAVLAGAYDPAVKDRPQVAFLPEEFRFLDLGAGIPPRIEP